MSEFTAHTGPTWSETEAIPDAEKAGRHLPRDEVMAEIVAHRQTVLERELRGGDEPPDPPPEPRREPRREPLAAPMLPERRELDLGDGRRINLTQADLMRLAETGLRIPRVAAAAVQASVQNNLTAIEREFPDIFADRDRSQLAAIQLVHLREQDAALGLQRPDLEAMREASMRTRALLGQRAEATHRSRRHAAEPRQASGRDVIAGMRRRRGQFA